MNEDKLKQLRIAAEHKQRSNRSLWMILLGVIGATAVVLYLAIPRLSDLNRSGLKSNPDAAADNPGASRPSTATATSPGSASTSGAFDSDLLSANRGVAGSILTVSGYIITRERIELSPRFMGVVKWIGVRKGDAVTNGQVVVLLDDTEYRARLYETEGRLANAEVSVQRAEIHLRRVEALVDSRVETQQALDDARLTLASARAHVQEIEGQIKLLHAYLDWTVIRSPIDGVVLEKLVDPNELVTPQSFGGTRGPSTALIGLADPKDLQVEIDLNEADLSKVYLGQKCKVSPEAYLDRSYDGVVVEIAPEASRQKGTLQIKVQIQAPDSYLTPELSAKVDFLR